ncbi:hypothetical protein G6F31_016584 [Rhizopus arrhizus]|nr:hypothetical protein G6F31_016584 [Rhizopus arrhizus]
MHDRAAEFERRAVFIHLRIAAPPDAEVDGFGPVDRSLDGGRQLRAVRGRDDRQAGQRAHRRDVFSGVMRGTVKAQADPGMVADQPDRQLGVCHVHADLFAAQQPQKRGEGGHERHHAGGGQAGRRRHHVLLGNAELHVAVLVGLGKAVQAVGILQVGRAGHHRVPGLRQFDQRIGKIGQPGVHRIQGAVLPGDTPLPLMVLAITHAGLARASSARRRRSSAVNSSRLWPSTS